MAEKKQGWKCDPARDVIDTKDISPTAYYPLKIGCKQMQIGYRTALNKIQDGTFPIPYKKIHARLIVLRGSDIIKYLEGGDWIQPSEPRYRRVG